VQPRPFKAREVPAHVYENRFTGLKDTPKPEPKSKADGAGRRVIGKAR
jgi:hypothetical protein